MKKTTIAIIVLLGVIAITSTLLLSSNKENKEVKNVIKTAINEVEDDNGKDLLKEAFIEGCTEEGGNYLYCSCTFNYVVDELGLKAFMSESIKYEEDGVLSDRMSDVLVDAIIKCVDKL